MNLSRWTVAALAALPMTLAAQTRGRPSAMPAALPPLKVIDIAYLNKNANACQDFFEYANGGWFDRDTIPAAYSSSGVGRDMGDRNELVVRSVLDDVMRRRSALPAITTAHKLGVFYATCMDSTSAERQGVAPVRPWLAGIDSVQDKAGLVA
ncbi:MAG TPA: hypothetical protein VGI83_02960, partial [Gemmatimonadales bacterium]